MAVERRDVEAALEARRELGPAYDDHLVDTLLAKLEERRPAPPAERGQVTPLILGSLVFGVAATAIATGNGAAWLAAIVWAAIAVINVAVIRYR
jgi:Flp pilus assembly protein TadB